VDAVVAPLTYGPPLDYYVQALKYRHARTLGRALALLLVPTLRALRRDFDVLVAVPLHRKRRCERGYNQAQEIARTLSRELRLPALQRGIVRCMATPAQTGQGAAERRAGVAQAFRVARDLTGMRIAIVDDVITTGATANALAAQLRGAGAACCTAIAVARTPEPPQERNV
jgi:ComF family protein